MFFIRFFLKNKAHSCIISKKEGGKEMENNNICRFSDVISSDLICDSFVYEKTEAQNKETRADKYILGFVVSGRGALFQSGKEYKLNAGDAFFVNIGALFKISGEGLSYIYISFYGRRADELTERFALSEENSVFCLKEYAESLTAFELDCLLKASDMKSDILIECGLLYLFSHLDTCQRQTSDLLSNIIALTNNSFTDPHFSLSVLAASFGYSAKYISFFFKKNKGIGFSEYLKSLRLKHSVFLIEQGITSVKNIALLSGFSDTLYFSKVFKNEIGKSPRAYIEHVEKGQK